MNCPKCKFQITKEYINIMTDVAQCQHCDYIFKISEVLSNEIDDGFNIDTPPNGAWIRTELNYIVIGATTRSPIAFFLVPFMIVWSGGSIGSIYGSQIVNGKFDPEMALFGIPFIIGSIIFWSIAAMAIWGKVEITIDNNGGKVFTGLQNIGLTKKFTWEDISTIKENQSTYKFPGSQGMVISLEGKKRISFGNGINESRRYYIYRALKEIILKVKSDKNLFR